MSQSTYKTEKTEESIPSNDDSSSDEEGWGFLLGGLSSEAMASTDWATDENTNTSQKVKKSNYADVRGRNPVDKNDPIRNNSAFDQQPIESRSIISNQHQRMSDRAFCVSPLGQILKPPVRILDRSAQDKGNVLVATQDIPKGSVIFTEKALEAIQVPSASSQDLYPVRGCQNCFKSLEPASCLASESIPFSELWPVPEYDSPSEECLVAPSDSKEPIRMMLDAKSRRVTCPDCGVIFCNHYCAMNHIKRFGDCCKCKRAIQGLVDVIVRSESRRLFTGDDDNHDDDDDDGEDDEEECASFVEINPVLVLAARMFIAQVRRYRADGSNSDNLFDALCGEADDMPALGYEASQPWTSDDTEDSEIPLQPLEHEYKAIATAIGLTQSERESACSLRGFHKLVAMAQRNSIALTTGSPFRTYYQSMLRKTGGRGSSRQQEVVLDVARLLGSKDGKLTRDMDRIVEEKVRLIPYLCVMLCWDFCHSEENNSICLSILFNL